jgi:hypothetical protein
VDNERPATLARAISGAIAMHDPVDPWLVVSNFDDHHWDDVGEQIAPSVRAARSGAEVYELIADALGPFVRDPTQDDYVRERIEAASSYVWGWLQTEPPTTRQVPFQ